METTTEVIRDDLPENPITEGKRIKRKDLVNILNYLNFQEGTLIVSFRHKKYGNLLSFRAVPHPCADNNLECRWVPPGISMTALRPYQFEYFYVSDGQNIVAVSPEVTHCDAKGIGFVIPDFGYEKKCRSVKRNPCERICIDLIQSGVLFPGYMIDFNAVSFRVEIVKVPGQSFKLINPELPVTTLLRKDGILVYSGDCVVVRQAVLPDKKTYVLAPNTSNLRRFRARQYRSVRHHLSPCPNINFRHPLTDKRVFLQVVDISSSGFSVEEFYDNSVLLPGLIIFDISLEIANHFIMKCTAQVLYRNVQSTEHGEGIVRCGFTLLDMKIEDQTRLSALLHQVMNPHSFVCHQVDIDELWKFFFESGFIYPSKYESIQSHKEQFKRTYEKLYLESPSIARHFVFQDKGSLFGHMSMVRFYTNSWIIHHHAAARSGYGMAGVSVLDQVGYYVNEFHIHNSTHMDYVMCYYRPDNRFPSRVFGGVAREIASPKGSSLDTFAYFHLPETDPVKEESFQLFPVHPEDLTELARYYESISAGLLLDALDLRVESFQDDSLSKEYQNLGFRRDRYVFALQKDGGLKAVIMVTLSDTGLNLSNLTNCIHVLVVDPEGLPPDILRSSLGNLRRYYQQDEFPVLVFPLDYMERYSISYEKKYTLWVLNMHHLDGYFKALDSIFKRVRHEQ